MDEPTGQVPTNGGNGEGLLDIAKRAAPPADGPKRGRGRPAGSGGKPAEPAAPAAPALPPVVWTEKNVGALVRLSFSTPAAFTGIKEISLNESEQEMIIPAAVECFNQFAPMAAAKYAAAVTLAAALITVSASKWSIYKEVREKEAEEKKAGDKIRGQA